jgi:hypothetical protein
VIPCAWTQSLRAFACLFVDINAQALPSLPCLARDFGQFDCSSRSRSSSNSGSDHSSEGNRAGRGCGGFSQLQLPPNCVTAVMVACLRGYQASCQQKEQMGQTAEALLSSSSGSHVLRLAAP